MARIGVLRAYDRGHSSRLNAIRARLVRANGQAQRRILSLRAPPPVPGIPEIAPKSLLGHLKHAPVRLSRSLPVAGTANGP